MYLFSSLYYCFKTSLKNILYTKNTHKDIKTSEKDQEPLTLYNDSTSEDYGFEFVDSLDNIV